MDKFKTDFSLNIKDGSIGLKNYPYHIPCDAKDNDSVFGRKNIAEHLKKMLEFAYFCGKQDAEANIISNMIRGGGELKNED